MKLLSLLTLGLHFATVMMLVGSLILVIILNFRGRAGKNLDLVRASHTLAKRLPVIMTYVINLGVPPLLFLQVLYGQQVYSSSVLRSSRSSMRLKPRPRNRSTSDEPGEPQSEPNTGRAKDSI